MRLNPAAAQAQRRLLSAPCSRSAEAGRSVAFVAGRLAQVASLPGQGLDRSALPLAAICGIGGSRADTGSRRSVSRASVGALSHDDGPQCGKQIFGAERFLQDDSGLLLRDWWNGITGNNDHVDALFVQLDNEIAGHLAL